MVLFEGVSKSRGLGEGVLHFGFRPVEGVSKGIFGVNTLQFFETV